jgi:hypothetical protein
MSNYLHLGGIGANWPKFGHCISENGIHMRTMDNAKADYHSANP